MKQEDKLSYFDTLNCAIKSIFGFGTFFMPVAFGHTGFIGGTICTIVFTLLYIYGIHLMLQCMSEARDRNRNDEMTMSETVTYAFREFCCHPCFRVFGYLVDILLVIVHFMIGAMYIVFIAENLKSYILIFEEYINIRIVIAIVTVCVLPLFLIKNIKNLVPLNIAGNILVLLLFFEVLMQFTVSRSKNLKPTHQLMNCEDIHLYIGFVMFSLSSVGVMVTLESKMQEPERYLGWTGILNRASLFILVWNLIFGICAYLYIGTAMVLPFFENLRVDIGKGSKIYAAVVLYLTYPLNGYIPIDIIFNQHISRGYDLQHPVRIEIIVRIVFLILTAAFALALPNLMPVAKLICAIALPLLNLIYPACTKLCLGYDSERKVLWIILHVSIIVAGIAVLLCGLYSAYYDITIYYLKDPTKIPFWDIELGNLE